MSVGARLHTESSVLPEVPFGDGDMSWGIAYERHTGSAYWQFGLSYAPKMTGTGSEDTNSIYMTEVDYALTPQINLLVKDSAWFLDGGIGVLDTYMPSDDENQDDWSGIYWQFILGLDIPLGKTSLKIHAYYPFEDWGALSDFDFDDAEYGAWLTYNF